MIHQISSLISRKKVQNAAVGYISDALAVAHIVQNLFELVPESKFFNFPGVSVEMPDSALFEHLVEQSFAHGDPAIEADESCQIIE